MSVFNVQRRSRSTGTPKQLRKQGLLPMALVERSHETMLIQAPIDMLREAMRHADGLGRLDLQIDGEGGQRKAIVKHVEQDVLKHELIHVTLQEVSDNDQVKVDIPVIAVGTPTAAADGELVLSHATDHIKIRGRMADLPERIEVDVTEMQAMQHIEAKDLQLPEGIELLSSPEATIFSLKPRPMAVIEETPETEEASEAEGAESPGDSSDES